MPRQRFIHPEFWSDLTIGKLSPIERLFFIGCVSNADDEGRLLSDPSYLRALIFPYDGLSPQKVRKVRDNVVSVCKNLILYSDDNGEYLAFLKWQEYQKPRYPQPSKLPPPPHRQEEALPQDCSNVAETLPQDCAMGRDGLGLGIGLGMGREGRGGICDDVASPSAEAADPLPIKAKDVVDLWNGICGDVLPQVQRITPERRKKINSRLVADKTRDKHWWETYFVRVRGSPFMTGDNDRQWQADFDFAVRSEQVVARVLEGRYDKKEVMASVVATDDRRDRGANRGRPAASAQRPTVEDYTGGRYGGFFVNRVPAAGEGDPAGDPAGSAGGGHDPGLLGKAPGGV